MLNSSRSYSRRVAARIGAALVVSLLGLLVLSTAAVASTPVTQQDASIAGQHADRAVSAVSTPPTIFFVNPSGGPTTGGTTVTITGSGFIGTTAVFFGGTSAAWIMVNNDNQITATAPAHTVGQVYIQVVSGIAGTSALTSAGVYTYWYGDGYGYGLIPVVTSVSPSGGPTTGGTSVVIAGSRLTGATSVTFGGTAALFTFYSDSQIVATAPPHAAGQVYVQVATGVGASAVTTAGLYTYGYGYGYGLVPAVYSVSPASGVTAGGAAVTITGRGFTGATSVTFGGTPANFTVYGDSTIIATTPAHAPGQVYVQVASGMGVSALTTTGVYTYAYGYGFVPAVYSVSPASGPATGGTTVTVTGSGFTGATSVTFGGTFASFTAYGDTTIVATTPAHTAGQVYVQVANVYGTSPAASGLFTYTYGAPALFALTPTSGAAGTTITLSGSGFTGATSVTFGGIAGTGLIVTSDATLAVVAPAHAPGTVAVIVYGPGGTSASNITFTYPTITTTPEVVAYNLNAGWNLIAWTSEDGLTIRTALQGALTPSSTTQHVTAVFRWDSNTQSWQAYFPGSEGVPGANDFTTLKKGEAYWIAVVAEGATMVTTTS